MFVREATAKDIPTIQALAEQVWPHTYAEILSQDQIGYMMEMMYSAPAILKQMEKGHRFLLVYAGDEAAGFASYAEKETHVYKLHKLYLARQKQGTGAGKFLLEFILNEVRKQGGKELLLNVNRNNRAIGFYRKMGFEILSTEDIDIGNGFYMNDYVMGKQL